MMTESTIEWLEARLEAAELGSARKSAAIDLLTARLARLDAILMTEPDETTEQAAARNMAEFARVSVELVCSRGPDA